MNHKLNLNLSDIQPLKSEFFPKNLHFTRDSIFFNEKMQLTYDEEFCLFESFPLNQLVILGFENVIGPEKSLSCTLLKLAIFYNNNSYYSSYKSNNMLIPTEVNNKSMIEKCEFEKREHICKLYQHCLTNDWYLFKIFL